MRWGLSGDCENGRKTTQSERQMWFNEHADARRAQGCFSQLTIRLSLRSNSLASIAVSTGFAPLDGMGGVLFIQGKAHLLAALMVSVAITLGHYVVGNGGGKPNGF